MLQEQSEVLYLKVRHLEGDPFAQDYIALSHLTPFIMNGLRNREAAYASHKVLVDYKYAQYSPAFPPIREIGPLPPHGRVVTESVLVDVWAWWANRYHSTLAYGWIDRRHQPVAIKIFLGLLRRAIIAIIPQADTATISKLTTLLLKQLN
ncbi:uncharacterized protein MYCFIDRAFT_212472 [Pseudocercospora fijiensis CIRAD86]|uniref:Uncharacterized protein n=1 Tax=Pseudocercospora fijiensis (strain CIRAD86) TaxID=383855 RepID=M3AMW1_PSEFD|nr:uncharacterized protein MYCFIDRAFT_212472 [Pseudocercospora fijiensis CIRAD86]EME78767.1 hypothetical protein MYCFIDRAFT_212472 [Pseudocercospora fijiensis CIRAD86]